MWWCCLVIDFLFHLQCVLYELVPFIINLAPCSRADKVNCPCPLKYHHHTRDCDILSGAIKSVMLVAPLWSQIFYVCCHLCLLARWTHEHNNACNGFSSRKRKETLLAREGRVINRAWRLIVREEGCWTWRGEDIAREKWPRIWIRWTWWT